MNNKNNKFQQKKLFFCSDPEEGGFCLFHVCCTCKWYSGLKSFKSLLLIWVPVCGYKCWVSVLIQKREREREGGNQPHNFINNEVCYDCPKYFVPESSIY